METKQTELLILEDGDIKRALMTGEGLQAMIDDVENAVSSIEVDIETEVGRKGLKSVAHRVSKIKTRFDNHRTALLSEEKKRIREIDGRGRKFRTEMDRIRDEVRKPVDEYEAREAARIERHQNNMSLLRGLAVTASSESGSTLPLDALKVKLLRLQETGRSIDQSWEEFADDALDIVFHGEQRLKNAIQMIEQENELREAREALERAEREKEEARRRAEEAKRREEQARAAEQAANERAEREKREAEEREARQREEEQRKIKEAEEAATRKALEASQADTLVPEPDQAAIESVTLKVPEGAPEPIAQEIKAWEIGQEKSAAELVEESVKDFFRGTIHGGLNRNYDIVDASTVDEIAEELFLRIKAGEVYGLAIYSENRVFAEDAREQEARRAK